MDFLSVFEFFARPLDSTNVSICWQSVEASLFLGFRGVPIFFTVNPDNPRCPDLSELAQEIAKDPVASWSIPGISPYLQKIRKGDRFLFLQQAGKGAPKNAPRGIIGCGDIVGRPLSGKFEKTGEAGWFVDLLFQHFIDPMKNPELRLDRKWILDQRWGQSVYFVPQSGWLVKPKGTGELILKAFLKRLARH